LSAAQGSPEPLRVLRVIARLNAGGPAHHVGILSTGLASRGYRTLLVHGRPAPDESALPGFDARYPTHRLELAPLSPDVRPLDDLRALAALVRTTRRFRPDLVHSHTAKAGFLARIAALAIRPRPLIVHTFHGHVLEGYFGRFRSVAYAAIERAMGRWTDRLIGVSQATVDDLVRLRVAPADRFRVVPLGLRLEPFLGVDPQPAEQRDDVVAATVGRLVAIKRIDVALRAVAHARTLGAGVRLLVVGDGPLRAQLAQLAAELGIADSVTFLGTRGDLPAIMRSVDVVVLSSDNEGTPVSLIEAGAAARPAVATDVGGVRDVVPAGAGVLVPRGDWRGMGAALRRLADAPAERRRLGARARAHVAGRYGELRLVDDMDALYRELAAGRPALR
jgi:glycosyltransferase involved in cell wall biosynthesis